MKAGDSVWEINKRAWLLREGKDDLSPDIPDQPPGFRRISLVSGTYPSLQVPGEEQRLITLHSPQNAWKEAESLAQKASLSDAPVVVSLGMGLGYHLLRLLPRLRPSQTLVMVEKEPEVFWAAFSTLDLTPLLVHPLTMFVIHPDFRIVCQHLRKTLGIGNGRSVRFFGHPPSLRAGKVFYREVINRLEPQKITRPRPLGLKQERFRVLIVNPDYFLIPEVMRAFRHLGHEVHLALFDKRHERGEEVVRRIVGRVEASSPDLIFTVNHLGMDRQGLLMDFFHRLRVPTVSWYVDSPALILNLYEGSRSELAYFFVWDPSYIPEVKAMGFEKVFPLPLATDPEIFRLRPAHELRPWQNEVAFVGNSLIAAVREKLARLPSSPQFLEIFRRLVEAYERQPFRRLANLLEEEHVTGHPIIKSLNEIERTDLEAGVIWEATRNYRLSCVKRLSPFHPVIYGDPGWQKLLFGHVSLRPEVNYYDDLPAVYGATAINFNATSLQMKTAVNQRVFDVPAAGGFLLTDYKDQLPELMAINQEVICYRHPDEIPELVRFYLKSNEARKKVINRARARVLAEHTYVHRVQTMVDTIRRTI